jgi:hypothetical protein
MASPDGKSTTVFAPEEQKRMGVLFVQRFIAAPRAIAPGDASYAARRDLLERTGT